MSKYHLEIAPAAERDIREAFLWYADRNKLTAHAFRTEALETIDRVGTSPLGSATDELGNRRRLMPRFPYSVFYQVTELTVTILAVAHHRRLPNYWLSITH